MDIKTLRIFNTNLRQVKRRLESLKDSLEEYEYWNNENKEVVELVKNDIDHHYSILNERIERGNNILKY